MSWVEFSKKQLAMIKHNYDMVEEVICEERKAVPQGYYVIYVKPDSTYLDEDDDYKEKPVPSELIGYWKTAYLIDIADYCVSEILDGYPWKKVKQVEVISYEWQEI